MAAYRSVCLGHRAYLSRSALRAGQATGSGLSLSLERKVVRLEGLEPPRLPVWT